MLSSSQLNPCLRISWFCECLCNACQPLSGHCGHGSRRQLNFSLGKHHNASTWKSNNNISSWKPYNNNTPTWKFYHNNNNNLQNNKTCNNNIFSHNRKPRQLLWYNVLLKERVSILRLKVLNLSLITLC